ncbi:MAG: hypothetical protein KDD49_11365 [Bacteroidetes bacterium]|nr:hypothetical protein [Bacteroidota bacterium]MCB9043245.1 hypothetical protein [Chitinophagales bacterium]
MQVVSFTLTYCLFEVIFSCKTIYFTESTSILKSISISGILLYQNSPSFLVKSKSV